MTALWYREMINVFVAQPRKLPQYWRALPLASGALGTMPSLVQPLKVWHLRRTGDGSGIVSECGADYQKVHGGNL